jgi:hypothetical protein
MIDGLTERLLDLAAHAGMDAVAEALISEVARQNAWLASQPRSAICWNRTVRRSSPSCKASGG